MERFVLVGYSAWSPKLQMSVYGPNPLRACKGHCTRTNRQERLVAIYGHLEPRPLYVDTVGDAQKVDNGE